MGIDRPLVMGILNATPDSFSDGGGLADPAAIESRVRSLLGAGADILDVGGESTRPGHAPVAAAQETQRILPVLLAIRAVDPGIPVSIDTRKAVVAEAALAAGADLVNDVSGLADPPMARLVRDAGCTVVLMRSRDLRGEVVAACRGELAALIAKAEAAGIRRRALVVDPGLGFGDPPGGDVEANLALLRSAEAYGHGLPVLVGASRKRFIGSLTGVAEPRGRVAGSVAAALLAVQGGARIVRVHDVAETVQALKVAGFR
jgi:dihydropteroate synthase